MTSLAICPPPRRIRQHPAGKREPGAVRLQEDGGAPDAPVPGQQQGQVDGEGKVGIHTVGGHACTILTSELLVGEPAQQCETVHTTCRHGNKKATSRVAFSSRLVGKSVNPLEISLSEKFRFA